MISSISATARSHLQIFKPETVLSWQRKLISKRWTYPNSKTGRRPIRTEIKNLILEMKNENSLWGCRRIADELKKLKIDIHHTTVNRIIQDFRKRGRIVVSGSWSRFLKAHWDSLYGMDFMSIDTIFGKRFYLMIVLKLSSREIAQWDLTEHPTREFVWQRIIQFQEKHLGPKVLIHDNAPQFTTIDYHDYGIKGVHTSVVAPNMKTEESERRGQVYLAIAELTMGATTVNAFTERVIGTIRREVLDHFLLVSEKQVRNIVSEYVQYYNRYRPHQGIGRIPDEEESGGEGRIVKQSIRCGLHHHYYRSSA